MPTRSHSSGGLRGGQDLAVHVNPSLDHEAVDVEVSGSKTLPLTQALAYSARGLTEDEMGGNIAAWLAEQQWTPGHQVTPLSVWLDDSPYGQ